MLADRVIVTNKMLLLDRKEVFSDVYYVGCELVLTEMGAPQFVNCTFVRCQFSPAYRNDSPHWRDFMHNCYVN